MKFFLIVAKGPKQGMPIEIAVDLFLIGSDRICQLRKDKLGSRHCALITREDKVFINDMDSGQSTIVNGSVMPTGAEWPLHAGDRITIGPLEFVIQFRESALSGKDLEEWAMRCLDKKQGGDDIDEEERAARHKTAAAAAASIINKLNAMKGMVKGRLRIGIEKGVTIIRFGDEMIVEEADISLIKKELCDNLNKPNLRVLFDLKTVKKFSSSAVKMLTDILRWLRPWGSTMAICNIRCDLGPAMALIESENIPIFTDKKVAMSEKW